MNQEFSPNNFEDVFSAELDEVAKRQEKPNGTEVDRKELSGLALSGGGIRSATSSLGVIQALKSLGLLGAFDYLSTVSGGGFTGGWWSAWTSRDFDKDASKDDKFFPPCEQIQPERDALLRNGMPKGAIDKSGISPEADNEARRKASDPVHHLRLFSNYLTPVKGFLSADTWRVNAVISRNLGLTWLVLIPMLFAAVLLAQSYFTIQPDSQMQFLYPYSHFAEDSTLAQDIVFEMVVIKSLDSIVHGARGVVALAPVRRLQEIGAQKHATDPYSQMIDNIYKLRVVDSDVAANADDFRTSPVLQEKLDTIEHRVILWHQVDSAIRANPDFTTRTRQEKLDSVRPIFQKALDPDVDTVRIKLARLKERLIDHRQQKRDSWLFNRDHMGYLATRAVWASFLPVMMLGWIAMLICLWMINSGHKMFGGNVLQGSYAFIGGMIAFKTLNWIVPHVVGAVEPGADSSRDTLLFELAWAVVALIILNIILWDDAHKFWKANRKSMDSEGMQKLGKLLDVRRSKIVTYHQRLLLGAFLVSVLFLFGGFGHEAINYLFIYSPGQSWDIWQNTSRLAGIAVVFSALAGTGFAARNAKTASDDAASGRGNPKPPSKIKSMLIGFAPPLILLLVMCGISWTSHFVLQALVFQGGSSIDQNYLVLVFSMWLLCFLSLYYSIFDLHFRARRSKAAGIAGKKQVRQFSLLLLIAILLTQVAMMVVVLVDRTESFRFSFLLMALPIAVWCIISWKYFWELKNPQKAAESNAANKAANTDHAKSGTSKAKQRASMGSRIQTIYHGSISSLLILGFSVMMIVLISIFMDNAELPIDHLFLVALCASVLVLVLDILWGIRAPEDGRRGNHEARLLLGINITLITLFLVIPPLAENQHWGVTHVLEILISLSIGVVIFIGWRVDPNALSIHEFYRNRIVRAYLGASNWLRNTSSVSDVHPDDDVALTALTNCEQGAPYHLVNTTLNLLGTKSLETAQRHASNFIMSKRYCGSVTTGFRPTEEYMSGTMTLGSAVAISGAAASPNMGSNQVSGATTMLMSLLNIRLGYWAANPGRARWRESQPKLWPYYLLKESLSQTTGFGAFCYLTDGGHFDNTGLYPLIERGCRYIVLCDNGADPHSHFKDLGNALRRCRIDFGAEFAFDGLKAMTSMGAHDTTGRAHWLRGTVKFSEEHLRKLWGKNWDEDMSPDERLKYKTGAILVLRPIILGDEPADVLQYGLEYADFPQQSTANQWFTEDQFESYRRLGYWSAQSAFASSDYSNASREEILKAIAESART